MGGMKWLIVVVLLALGVVGCNSGTTKSFSVEVHNQSTQPITLWLTKDGPPMQEGWLTPEKVVEDPERKLKYDLAFVPAGKTGYTDPMPGEFPKGTNAVLRVYVGEKEVFDLAKDANHVDTVLKPGSNRLLVVEQAGGGGLVVEPGK